jgi:hypothetical protein
MRNAIQKIPPFDKTSVRFGKRRPLDLPVALRTDDSRDGRGIIRNASLSGAFVETSLDLPMCTNLLVTLADRRSTAAPRVLNACVTRVDAYGVGIEWRDMASLDVLEILDRATRATDAGQGISGAPSHNAP